MYQEFKDTKRIRRSGTPRTDRQYNGQKIEDNTTLNGRQNIEQKFND